MNSLTALANRAFTSILGAIGSGAAGGPSSNNLSQINAAPIGPSATPQWDSSPFTSRTGRVLVMGTMSLSGGTLADTDQVTGNLLQDGVGISAQTVTGASGAVADFASVMIVTVTPGVAHTFSVAASVGGGHTASIATGHANITCIDL